MPQPFDPQPGTQVEFGSKALGRVPDVSKHIGMIAMAWTNIEVNVARLLADLLHVDADLALSLYVAVTNDGSRDAMVRVIAQRTLAGEDLERFNAMMSKLRERRGERNDVVHGMWGVIDGRSDILLWTDPRVYIMRGAEWFNPKPLSPIKYVAYNAADFEAIDARIGQFFNDHIFPLTLMASRLRH